MLNRLVIWKEVGPKPTFFMLRVLQKFIKHFQRLAGASGGSMRHTRDMHTIKKLWVGGYPLGTAFWGFYVFGILAGWLIAGMTAYMSRYIHAHAIGFLIGLSFSRAYGLVASVGVWKSARAGMTSPVWMDRIAPIVARLIVLSVAGRILWNLINGGALVLMGIATGSIRLLMVSTK
jgi:hypothetical protein